MEYLLDTNHISLVLREDAGMAARILAEGDSTCAVCYPVAGELWYMVFKSRRIDTNVPALRRLLERFKILDFDMRAAVEFGRIKAELGRVGLPIPAIDVQVAAIAIVNDLTLLTADARHMRRIPRLRCDNWLPSRGDR